MISPNCSHFVQTCDVFFVHLIPWGSRVACPSVLCEKKVRLFTHFQQRLSWQKRVSYSFKILTAIFRSRYIKTGHSLTRANDVPH